jgi:glutamine amidotransferase
VIVDYDMGNLRSVSKAFEHLRRPVKIARDPETIRSASRLVLPGVGAFPDGMKNLSQSGLIEPIREFIKTGRPFLGICLGMQLLFTESEEFGRHSGLDILSGFVRRLNSSSGFKVPHMGWNQLRLKTQDPLFNGIQDGASVYFVHSYYVDPEDQRLVATETSYDRSFPSSILRENILACQFHPEKSQAVGLRLLENFAGWSP